MNAPAEGNEPRPSPSPPPPPPPRPRPVSAMSADELAALFKSWGEPAFRATQLGEFFYRKGLPSYEQVTNLSRALRARLAREAPLYELVLQTQSAGDEAVKWLWRAADGA